MKNRNEIVPQVWTRRRLLGTAALTGLAALAIPSFAKHRVRSGFFRT